MELSSTSVGLSVSSQQPAASSSSTNHDTTLAQFNSQLPATHLAAAPPLIRTPAAAAALSDNVTIRLAPPLHADIHTSRRAFIDRSMSHTAPPSVPDCTQPSDSASPLPSHCQLPVACWSVECRVSPDVHQLDFNPNVLSSSPAEQRLMASRRDDTAVSR